MQTWFIFYHQRKIALNDTATFSSRLCVPPPLAMSNLTYMQRLVLMEKYAIKLSSLVITTKSSKATPSERVVMDDIIAFHRWQYTYITYGYVASGLAPDAIEEVALVSADPPARRGHAAWEWDLWFKLQLESTKRALRGLQSAELTDEQKRDAVEGLLKFLKEWFEGVEA